MPAAVQVIDGLRGQQGREVHLGPVFRARESQAELLAAPDHVLDDLVDRVLLLPGVPGNAPPDLLADPRQERGRRDVGCVLGLVREEPAQVPIVKVRVVDAVLGPFPLVVRAERAADTLKRIHGLAGIDHRVAAGDVALAAVDGGLESSQALLAGGGAGLGLVELLAARIRAGSGDLKGALDLVAAALLRHPTYRPLRYAYLGYLQALGRHQEAIETLIELGKLYPRDPQLWNLRAKSYAALGKRLLQHQALAEVYFLQGTLRGAVEQLQLAQRSGDGDFYQLSSVEARLREFRNLLAEEAKDMKSR